MPGVSATISGAQKLFLLLCSGVTPGGVENSVSIQDEHLHCYIITPSPILFCFYFYAGSNPGPQEEDTLPLSIISISFSLFDCCQVHSQQCAEVHVH